MAEIISTHTSIANPGTVSADLLEAFIRFIDTESEKTRRTYVTNLRQFKAWLNYSGIGSPSAEDVREYRDFLLNEHRAILLDLAKPEGWSYRKDASGEYIYTRCKASTVKIYLQSVKQFFSWTAKHGYYPNIAEDVKKPKVSTVHRKDALTAAEVLDIQNKIRNAAAARSEKASTSIKDRSGKLQRSTEQGSRLICLYLLAVNAGLRTVELSRANVGDIGSKAGKGFLMIYGKGRSEPDQVKPIAPEIMEELKHYLSLRSDNPTSKSPLFVSTSNRSKGKRIASTTISTMLKEAMIEAGYNSQDLTAHSLRHTAGRNIMQLTDNNIYLTQRYMRHADPKTTELYLEADNTEIDADLSERLYKFYQSAGAAGK